MRNRTQRAIKGEYLSSDEEYIDTNPKSFKHKTDKVKSKNKQIQQSIFNTKLFQFRRKYETWEESNFDKTKINLFILSNSLLIYSKISYDEFLCTFLLN